METLLVLAAVALILVVQVYAIQHGRPGMAVLLFLVPGLASFWIPLHHHDAHP